MLIAIVKSSLPCIADEKAADEDTPSEDNDDEISIERKWSNII